MKTYRFPGALVALTLIALTGLALTARPAQAQTTVYSTFGPGNSFDHGVGYGELGPNASPPFGADSHGSAFTVTQSGTLSTLTVAEANDQGTNIGHFYLTDNIADVGITANALDSFTVTSLPAIGAGSIAPEVLNSTLNPILSTGTTYYLYGLETGDTFDTFYFNDLGLMGTILENENGGPYTSSPGTLPAFSVQVNPSAVTATPEPASYAAFAMGGFGLLGLGMKTRMMKTRKRSA